MTNLERILKERGLTVEQLAEKASWYQESKTTATIGVLNHYVNTIRKLEGANIICPQPRRTYEYKNIAKALKCSVNELIEGKK